MKFLPWLSAEVFVKKLPLKDKFSFRYLEVSKKFKDIPFSYISQRKDIELPNMKVTADYQRKNTLQN